MPAHCPAERRLHPQAPRGAGSGHRREPTGPLRVPPRALGAGGGAAEAPDRAGTAAEARARHTRGSGFPGTALRNPQMPCNACRPSVPPPPPPPGKAAGPAPAAGAQGGATPRPPPPPRPARPGRLPPPRQRGRRRAGGPPRRAGPRSAAPDTHHGAKNMTKWGAAAAPCRSISAL